MVRTKANLTGSFGVVLYSAYNVNQLILTISTSASPLGYYNNKVAYLLNGSNTVTAAYLNSEGKLYAALSVPSDYWFVIFP